ncbi:SigE family RNA polymerase sigma factor [Dactylosporangium aurantiacum]|uniref:SigE family RNA polymerase sigma factor n=1 Tax=Dactylosporangium aurantiacum TaxID=35754 RepID=A0A9Q9MD70_9ACTN|nr:SigE family RNA polymerase sigma factor [Dactylosporangium aurantiacum]MDG6101206.1 SigE family RNA polymerase sigma factor [Dactylosporangium aurantiacum]UWZ54773.1 SigE family RNA polymerase sigma factor [Dactylosporangium aurantiacum]
MSGSDAQYVEFVRARSHALLRSAYLLTGDQHLAEDLVQEALARTHRAWRRLHEGGNAEAYARKVMYHTQVSFWRRRRAPESMPGDLPETAGGTDLAETSSQRVVLEQALRSLSPKQRAVVVLRYFEDQTEAATAELLGVSVGTVKTQGARGLERLRALVPELGTIRAEGGLR